MASSLAIHASLNDIATSCHPLQLRVAKSASAGASPSGSPRRVPDSHSHAVVSSPRHGHPGSLAVSNSHRGQVFFVNSESDGSRLADAPLWKLEATIRPWQLNAISEAFVAAGIQGMTVSDLRLQCVDGERFKGNAMTDADFADKVRVEVVLLPVQLDLAKSIVATHATTHEPGDGFMTVVPVVDAIRIRTGERGLGAILKSTHPTGFPKEEPASVESNVVAAPSRDRHHSPLAGEKELAARN